MNSNVIWFAIVSTIVLLSGVTGITIYQDVFAGQGEKVDVCHKGKTINIDPSAVPKHIAHGDQMGPCSEPPQETGTLLECKCGNGDMVSECFENYQALCDPSSLNAKLARCGLLCDEKKGNASTDPVCTVNACTPEP